MGRTRKRTSAGLIALCDQAPWDDTPEWLEMSTGPDRPSEAIPAELEVGACC
jgi:hypothetical protein